MAFVSFTSVAGATTVWMYGTDLNVAGDYETDIIDVRDQNNGRLKVSDLRNKIPANPPCKRAQKANGNNDPNAVSCPSWSSRIVATMNNGDDVIVVSAGVKIPARLLGGAGTDFLWGGGGGDFVDGGPGSDYPNEGGVGNDAITDSGTSTSEQDYASGGEGSDVIWLDAGPDIVHDDPSAYGAGRDVILTGRGRDRVELVNDNIADTVECGQEVSGQPDPFATNGWDAVLMWSHDWATVTNCELAL